MKLNEEVDDNLSFVRTNHRRDSSTSLTIIKHTLYGLRCSCVLNFKSRNLWLGLGYQRSTISKPCSPRLYLLMQGKCVHLYLSKFIRIVIKHDSVLTKLQFVLGNPLTNVLSSLCCYT